MPSLEMPSGEMNEISAPPIIECGNGEKPAYGPMPLVTKLSSGKAEENGQVEMAGEWTKWQNLKGCCVSSPTAASWGADRLDVFAIGTDSQLYHKSWDGDWSNWVSLGGTCIYKPAAVSWGKNRLDVFAIGIDKQVYRKWWDGSKWNGWENLGGTCIHGIAATSWGEGRIDLFTVGTNSVIYHQYFADGEWQGWQPLKLKDQDDWEKSSTSICAPAAAALKQGRIDIFTLGIDNHVYQAWGDGESWNGWQDLGGQAIQGVAAASRGDGCLHLFTVSTDVDGTDNHLYHRVMNAGSWSDWENLGGVCVSAPAAVAVGNDRVDTFVVGTRSGLWQKTWTSENKTVSVQTVGRFETVTDIDGVSHEIWYQGKTCGCGPSCVAMVARKFQRGADESWISSFISRLEGKTIPGDPIHDFNKKGTWNVQEALRSLGITSAYTDKSGKFTTIFRDRCTKNKPAMAWLVWTQWYLWNGVRWEWEDISQDQQGEHWVVILGPSSTNPGKYIVLDPWYSVSAQDFPPVAPAAPPAPPGPAPVPAPPAPPLPTPPLSEHFEYIVQIPYGATWTWKKGEFRNVDSSGVARGVITTI